MKEMVRMGLSQFRGWERERGCDLKSTAHINQINSLVVKLLWDLWFGVKWVPVPSGFHMDNLGG